MICLCEHRDEQHRLSGECMAEGCSCTYYTPMPEQEAA